MTRNDRLAQFFEMASALLFAMVGVIVFGWPQGSVVAGALTVWMFTFMHLCRKIDVVLRELRHARQVSEVQADDPFCGPEPMSMVPLSREEKEKA